MGDVVEAVLNPVSAINDNVENALMPEAVKKQLDKFIPENKAAQKFIGLSMGDPQLFSDNLKYTDVAKDYDPEAGAPAETEFPQAEIKTIMENDKARRRLLRRAMFLSQDTNTARAGAVGL